MKLQMMRVREYAGALENSTHRYNLSGNGRLETVGNVIINWK